MKRASLLYANRYMFDASQRPTHIAWAREDLMSYLYWHRIMP